MDELVAFLRARYDEEACLAYEATHAGLGIDIGPDDKVISAVPEVQDHIATWHPARVLREVEAKRRLVALHAPVTLRRRVGDQMGDVVACEYDTDPDGMGWIDHPCETLRLLALPYADHPDYREEWRP